MIENLVGREIEFADASAPKALVDGSVRRAKDRRVVLCVRAGSAPRAGRTLLIAGASIGVESVGQPFKILGKDHVYVYFAARPVAAKTTKILDEDEAAHLESARVALLTERA